MLDDDEKMVRNGDRPFTKAKRSNCDMLDRNELQTYASLEKMLHKAIFAMLFRNSKRRETPTLLLHQNSNFEKDSKNVLNKNEFSGPLNALDIGAYDLGLGSFVSIQEGPNEEQNSGHQANHEKSSSIQKRDQTQGEQCSDYDSFAYNHFPFNVQDLRTNIFEEGGNDAPQSMDQYMEPAQHGD
ncbi:hypothetical protein F2Q69_00037410 [Brassica cretica]|uniref:Uncharacterized protein n=1 Tax=Brassica cretica TaxID=69181 RepID=A0A8S9STV1_BRACR|nr:hypothetical protein F2Q69_00037410 [Brassica cretica]